MLDRPRILAVSAGAVGLALAALAARALWLEPRQVRLTTRTLRLPRWPAELEGLRVAVIADLHTGAPHVGEREVARIVERMNTERPDLVTLLGDYVDPAGIFADPVSPEAVAARLGELRAPLGVFAVLGNHDWVHAGERMPEALREAGIEVLENEAAPVERAPGPLWLVGLSVRRRLRPAHGAVLDSAPADAPVLALSHTPDVFPRIPEHVSLTLSGHTHGGQVGLPLIRGRLVPSRFGDRYAGGHVVENGKHLFVTRGVGTSHLPIRFRARPEVAVLRLTSAPR